MEMNPTAPDCWTGIRRLRFRQVILVDTIYSCSMIDVFHQRTKFLDSNPRWSMQHAMAI